jgi:transcription termination factor Rho
MEDLIQLPYPQTLFGLLEIGEGGSLTIIGTALVDTDLEWMI